MIRPHFFPVIVCLTLALGTPAAAQTPAPAPAAPAAQPAPNPNALRWTVTSGINISLQRGTTDTSTYNLQGEVTAANARRSYSIQADHTFMKVSPARGVNLKTADNQHVRATFRQVLSRHTYVLARPSFKRDDIQKIDYAYDALGGFGIWGGNARARIDFVPVAGVVRQKKNITRLDGTSGTGGIYQQLNARLNSAWRFGQNFLYLQNFKDSEDYRMQALLNLAGRIKGPFSMSVTYMADHENLVVVGSDKTNQQLMFGVQVQFPAGQ